MLNYIKRYLARDIQEMLSGFGQIYCRRSVRAKLPQDAAAFYVVRQAHVMIILCRNICILHFCRHTHT